MPKISYSTCYQEYGNLKLNIMIYKVVVGDQTYTEAEACFIDKIINIHIAQGYEENGDIKYTHFTNFSLNKRQCEELIKSLKLSITDLISYETES